MLKQILGWTVVALGLAAIALSWNAPPGLQVLVIVVGLLLALGGAGIASPSRPRGPGFPSRGDRPRPFRVTIEVPMDTSGWAIGALRASIEEESIVERIAADPDDEELVLVTVRELATTAATAERVARRKLERAGLLLERSTVAPVG